MALFPSIFSEALKWSRVNLGLMAISNDFYEAIKRTSLERKLQNIQFFINQVAVLQANWDGGAVVEFYDVLFYELHVVEVDKEGFMDAYNLWIIFKMNIKMSQGLVYHDLILQGMQTGIIAHAFDIQKLVEMDVDQFFIAFYVKRSGFSGCVCGCVYLM